MTSIPLPRILLVEDEPDLREALAQLLDAHGFDLREAATAEDAVESLRTERFDLVLTDYSLARATGTFAVREARAKGYLEPTTPVILVTAHPAPELVSGMRLVRKPFDIEELLGLVNELLADKRRASVEAAAIVPLPQQPEASVDLVLYVSSRSLASLRALRNLRRVLDTLPIGTVKLDVIDLSEHPDSKDAADDHIAFTPTLVQRRPQPRRWILGSLDDRSVLDDILANAGVDVPVAGTG